jgi:hypothetical protein
MGDDAGRLQSNSIFCRFQVSLHHYGAVGEEKRGALAHDVAAVDRDRLAGNVAGG